MTGAAGIRFDSFASLNVRRVLLIGKRASVLTSLQSALREVGIEADLAQDVTAVRPDGLRRYDAVAFGRAVKEDDRARMRAVFTTANPSAIFIDGLAPITPLLVAQFEEALGALEAREKQIGHVRASVDRLEFELRVPARMRAAAYNLTLLYRTRILQLLDRRLDAGPHHLPLARQSRWAQEVFVVLRADDREVRVIQVPR
jgi:hypothetical protein